MEPTELARAVAALLHQAPLAHPAYVGQETRDQWRNQLTLLLGDVLSHTDMWTVLPPMSRDAPPPGVELLGVTLCFMDPDALYRVIPWTSEGKLVMRVERTPFSTPMRVSVADNRSVGRSWQFLDEGQNFNLNGYEGPNTTAFLHELARRFKWPLHPA